MLHAVYIYIYLIIDARFNLIYKRKIFLAISIFYALIPSIIRF